MEKLQSLQRRRFAITALLAGTLLLSAARAAVVDVTEIVGKSMAQVQQILGSPLQCKKSFQGLSCDYALAEIEVIFIDEKADWITFGGFQQVEFDYRVLEKIGLIAVPPLVHNPFRMHWQNHQGLAVISVYGSGRWVTFVQVRAFTPQ